jgi:hypothetical protein
MIGHSRQVLLIAAGIIRTMTAQLLDSQHGTQEVTLQAEFDATGVADDSKSQLWKNSNT